VFRLESNSLDTVQSWDVIARIPEAETGYEYSALASYRNQLILVGGRSKVNSWDVSILFLFFYTDCGSM
jgi:hypothetical protein